MTADLATIAAEIERHTADGGWDQPPRLYALVNTGELVASEPQLAETLAGNDPDGLTPVEQEELDGDPLELLGRLGWPASVHGCAFVNEVVMLPDGATVESPEDAYDHPDHRDVRIVVAVTRDGARASTIRIRGRDGGEDEVLSAPDLVPNLAAVLAESLAVPLEDSDN